MSQRSEVVSARFTPEEKALVEQRAKAEGLTVSQYVSRAAASAAFRDDPETVRLPGTDVWWRGAARQQLGCPACWPSGVCGSVLCGTRVTCTATSNTTALSA